MELLGETAHPNYRLFLSAEPAATASAHIIPQVCVLVYCNFNINDLKFKLNI
jgi:hypothetical protein